LWNEFNMEAAFHLVQKAEKYLSDNPDFIALSSWVLTRLTILTDPPGADVYIRDYTDIEGEWEKLGKTPIDSMPMPNYSFYLMRLEKTGYEDVLAVAATGLDTLFRKLPVEGKIPPGMVYVEGYWNEVTGVFLEENLGFYMDRYEVTNKQYKEFVDNGGYSNPEYWKHEFVKDGRVLTREEAMAEFTDKSGRPGPATWQASDYPDGQDDYPVSGVSWYEAAAYAAYAGKSLPTGDHWDSGAGFYLDLFSRYFGSSIFQLSNFNGKGPEPVGTYPGINLFGTYDMAGNVREWCWNETELGRIICGGAWDDATYLYSRWGQLPPFDRSPENGFRCVQYIDREHIPETAFRLINLGGGRDYSKEEPVPEEIFQVYKNQFLYDSTGLEAMVEKRDDSHADWVIEKITFNAVYGNERAVSYLYLPRKSNPPFQTLIFFPGSYALWEEDLVNSKFTKYFLDYLLKNGRAVMYPVYKGTYERSGREEIAWGQTHQYTQWLAKWTKDFSRSIDYLETRSDIETSKLGFYGHSWGGALGGIIPAVEDRIKVNILLVGGFSGRHLPEADILNYVSRIKMPVLMLNGRYDVSFPFETTVKPFYDLLGTPEKDKHLYVYETDHFVPKSEMIKETLNFLDQYFGPVH
jgi:cephalosporin-C deacetylase-like acetyl esterase